jgi:hypothetical protein
VPGSVTIISTATNEQKCLPIVYSSFLVALNSVLNTSNR